MGEISGALYDNLTETQLVKAGNGKVYGVVVNSHSSGTLKLQDGVDDTAGANATGVFTISGGNLTPAKFAESIFTGSSNFLDDVKATGTYTINTSLTAGVHAESVLTTDTTAIEDESTVTIGSTVYRFMGTPAQAYDVKRTGTVATDLDNLKLAINASGVGDGTDYYTGTVAHPDVIATDNTDTTQKVVSRVQGTANNAKDTLASTSPDSHLDWADTTLGGGTGDSVAGVAGDTVVIDGRTYTFVTALSETSGADAVIDQVLWETSDAVALDNFKDAINYTTSGANEGTKYSTGTVIHATVTATTNGATTQVVEAQTAGSAGGALATTTTSAGASWGDTTLEGGTDAETITIGSVVYRWKDTPAQAYDINIGTNLAESLDFLKLAINGTGTGDGTDYYAGTVAHPYVIATANDATTQKINSRTYGTGNNTLATTDTTADGSWEDTTLGGGTGSSIAGVATAGSTFTVGDQSYYFTTILSETLLGSGSAVANEILWVTNDATALDNMKTAINGSGTEGTDYSTGTDANTEVVATTNTNTAQTVEARLVGTLGNSIATTDTATNASWASATLTGGTDKARLMLNTYSFPTGSSVVTFPEPINFVNGLFVTIGATADITVIYN